MNNWITENFLSILPYFLFGKKENLNIEISTAKIAFIHKYSVWIFESFNIIMLILNIKYQKKFINRILPELAHLKLIF